MLKKIKTLFKRKKKNSCTDCAKNYPYKCPRCRLKDDYDNDIRTA